MHKNLSYPIWAITAKKVRNEDFKQLKLFYHQKLTECRQGTNNQPLLLYRDLNRKKQSHSLKGIAEP